jgi:hypothetical protein
MATAYDRADWLSASATSCASSRTTLAATGASSCHVELFDDTP